MSPHHCMDGKIAAGGCGVGYSPVTRVQLFASIVKTSEYVRRSNLGAVRMHHSVRRKVRFINGGSGCCHCYKVGSCAVHVAV